MRQYSNYQGEGDVTEVKLGIGWEVIQEFSIGLLRSIIKATRPRFHLDDRFDNRFGYCLFSSIVGSDNYSISSSKGHRCGVQWVAVANQKRR